MSEMIPTPAPVPAPAPAVESAPAPAPAAPVQVPAGFVPQADLDRVEAQRRGFQSELTTVKQQLAALQAPAAPAAPTVPGDAASELAALRQEIARDRNVAALSAHVPNLQSEFSYADPYYFQPDTLGEYESPEALRATVEADHNRIAAIVQAAVDAKEAEIKAALGGRSPLGPVAPPAPGVDPTVQQLNAMSSTELEAFQKANPGVVERILHTAMAAQG